jgi:hypothetical protein
MEASRVGPAVNQDVNRLLTGGHPDDSVVELYYWIFIFFAPATIWAVGPNGIRPLALFVNNVRRSA